ncbi:MAG: protein phosphatase 2C domain-containing protein [Candidatus Electrothrix sp. AU1_5]|nr:protein phosphatase 2C domain-containing protein [Candidatus Electrothrix gigas]
MNRKVLKGYSMTKNKIDESKLTGKIEKLFWNIAACSVVGTSHIQSEEPCHDSFAYKLFSDGKLIIAVSDGAGSAKRPKQGSAFIVQSSIDFLIEKLKKYIPDNENDWKELVKNTFKETRKKLVEFSESERCPLSDYAATFLLVVLTEEWTIGGLIGDSAAVILTSDEGLYSICPPQKGEYANMTNFLTKKDALDLLCIHVKKDQARAVAAFSDGLLELAVNIVKNKPHPPFFNPLFSFIAEIQDEQEGTEHLVKFLNSERINSRTDDDKTLVLASRKRD